MAGPARWRHPPPCPASCMSRRASQFSSTPRLCRLTPSSPVTYRLPRGGVDSGREGHRLFLAVAIGLAGEHAPVRFLNEGLDRLGLVQNPPLIVRFRPLFARDGVGIDLHPARLESAQHLGGAIVLRLLGGRLVPLGALLLDPPSGGPRPGRLPPVGGRGVGSSTCTGA
jgi:hypothetical protein